MKQRITAIILTIILLLSLSGCKSERAAVAKEESGGTGYGAVRKTALTEQDLYFFTYGISREKVQQHLGSPQESLMTDSGVEIYQLEEGQTLKLTYSERGTVEEALYTDLNGREQSLYDYLTALGILKTVGGSLPGSPVTTPDTPAAPDTETEAPPVQQPAKESYFADKTYSFAVAEQILKEGVARETVVSALGKPNRFSSVSFANDSYIIDVYVMNDGSILYLDYGYLRESLRAMRKVDGSTINDLIGIWGAEEKPQNFYRSTKNKNVFTSVKKGSTPAAIYQRFGEPDWLEGDENHYRAVYKLLNDAALYFDFGTGNAGLSSAYIREGNGSISVFALR